MTLKTRLLEFIVIDFRDLNYNTYKIKKISVVKRK